MKHGDLRGQEVTEVTLRSCACFPLMSRTTLKKRDGSSLVLSLHRNQILRGLVCCRGGKTSILRRIDFVMYKQYLDT